jgi:cysteine synthase A
VAANWVAAWRLAETLPSDALVVTVFADAGPPEEWERAHVS